MEVHLRIWDTVGAPSYETLSSLYTDRSHGAIVVYDITRSESFKRAQFWVEKLRCEAAPSIVIALAGNMLDAIDDPCSSSGRQVETDEARTYAKTNNLLFFETSAKTGEQVTELFHSVAAKIAAAIPEGTGVTEISLSKAPGKDAGGGCCY